MPVEPPPPSPKGEQSPLKTSFARGYRYPWSVTAGAALVALMIGYFLGREHVKYEIRSVFSGVGKAVTEGLQESSGNDVQTGIDRSGTINTEPRLPDPVDFGKPFTAPEFELSLVEARIDRPEINALIGDAVRGENNLLLVFHVKNTHDRRILRYEGGNRFLAGRFQLRDDVDNVIRGVSYGFGSGPVGALSVLDDIIPGEEATHLEVFSVPPPKTEYLVLTLDLAAFGGEGKARFMIPVESIDNFSS